MSSYTPTWILVADASRARLFNYAGFDAPLELLKEHSHPESRAMERDLATDAPGRVSQSSGEGHQGHGHSSSAQHGTLKDHEHELFARTLMSELEHGLAAAEYGRLILVANPEFLGILRQVGHAQVQKHIVHSVPKNYTGLGVRDLEKQLAEFIHS